MTAPHYTSADLDALSDLVMSPGYGLLRDRVEAELERRRLELERALDDRTTWECRGTIRALRTVLDLPTILHDGMKTQIAKDEEDGV